MLTVLKCLLLGGFEAAQELCRQGIFSLWPALASFINLQKTIPFPFNSSYKIAPKTTLTCEQDLIDVPPPHRVDALSLLAVGDRVGGALYRVDHPGAHGDPVFFPVLTHKSLMPLFWNRMVFVYLTWSASPTFSKAVSPLTDMARLMDLPGTCSKVRMSKGG